MKRPDQIVLQTWHGPPFKRIGFDSQRIEESFGRNYRERLRQETSSWDYLISPSPAASPIMRSAFRFGGHLLETGSPRTDIFLRPDREAIAASVRHRLGVPQEKKVVLYAPTFRDDQQYGRRRRREYKFEMQLDLELAREALGQDHVLLVRRHTRVVDNVISADGDFVRDVSLYPDVNELLLASDVLITDYSSLIFDYANTGRPMVFFTYDLEDYRDRLRGFYFDVERVPGPLLRTSEEVVAAVRDSIAVRQKYASRYDDFVRDFCAFDDGRHPPAWLTQSSSADPQFGVTNPRLAVSGA
jgi:CDP-glycerol glycerophosphotransferase